MAKEIVLQLAKDIEDYYFLYNTRKHPVVAKQLSGKPPKTYQNL